MTLAVCVHCGEFKFGSLVPCEKCEFNPLATEDDFIYSMVLSDHYFGSDVLRQISDHMLRGGSRPNLSGEQVAVIRRQYAPQYERMKSMFGGMKRKEQKKGILSRFFGD